MNETLQVLTNHRTNRHFIKEAVMPSEHVDAILKAAQQAPSWMNGQHYSVIVCTDHHVKEKLVQLMPRNPHLQSSALTLLFCLDVRAMALSSQMHEKSFESEDHLDLLLTSTIDASLAMQNATVASESLGYGTGYVGGVRFVAKEVIALFDLPKYVMPLCCLTIGKVDETCEVERVKPRFDRSAKVGCNAVAKIDLNAVRAYDDVIEAFAEKREVKKWSEKFADYYAQNTSEQTKNILREQGF